MDACMEETLRVGKITSRLARSAVADTEVLGYRIPKGASVTLNPYVGGEPFDIPEELRSKTSRQSKDNFQSHWDAKGMDQWVPERWLAEDESFNPHSFPRLAFSAGPRVCYGMFYLSPGLPLLISKIANMKDTRQNPCVAGVSNYSHNPGFELQVWRCSW